MVHHPKDPDDAQCIAGPIVKWAGGKHDSVPHIVRRLPPKIATYYEPFFGGGAVFFKLAALGRFERAVISDACEELMVAHQAIRDDVEGVIDAIRRLGPSRVTEAKYYRIRAAKPRTPATRAARFLFLNKNGFNGLYRVNHAGEFNVPWGKRTSWRPDYENLRAVSRVLQNVEIFVTNYQNVTEGPICIAKRGDAVYFDPPYLMSSKTARFTAYTQWGFGFHQQQELAATFETLATRGVHVLASNAEVRATMKLYGDIEGTEYWRIPVRRAINSNGARRGKVGELLMVNPGNPGE